jgi:serine phosphatase RsbU (regulator of sigma subunit)
VVAQADTQVVGLAALARALAAAALQPTLAAALEDLAAAARTLAGADVALVRTPAGAGRLETVAVAGPAALAAELGGTQLAAGDVPPSLHTDLATAPPAVRRAAARAGARSALILPVGVGDELASLELYRAGPAFTDEEQVAAELAAAQTALVLRAFRAGPARAEDPLIPSALELAGEALAAALGETHAADEVVRVAASVVGAPVGLLWEHASDGLVLTASYGLPAGTDLARAQQLAHRALEEPGPPAAVPGDGLPDGCGISTTLALGQPVVGLLQLLFSGDQGPDNAQLGRLTTFGVRAAHALRASARAQSLALELERTRALLAVVAQATAELSLAHTLETAVERVSELLDVEAVAVYLRTDDDRLAPAAARALAGPHTRVAERLLELSFGPRERALVDTADVAGDARLRDVRDAAREAGIDAAVAVPLRVRNAVTGLLAVYPPRGRRATENEEALLSALAAQLAVAVQNAQLHERETRLKREVEEKLVEARTSARRLSALYEISWSFTEKLSLEKTLDTLAETIVGALDVDAALIRMPDERRELLTARALHVQDEQLADAVRVILWRAEPFGAAAVQRLFRQRVPYWLTRGHEYLEPFLARGWTAVVLPVAKGAETIAALTLLSFRPGAPLTQETVDDALKIVGQAALALDNARLYQQQKEFAETMQRSLLPSKKPEVPGLELGQVYESSARVEVGGDVYDYLALEDGRLAVVLGDVTGHGVEATADMAMAKFVFRSLAREHPSPSEFLAAANDVVVDEIAPGKFITMTYVAVDAEHGEVACASAGHPPPRLVLPDGTVKSLDALGLVLGIDSDQTYEEVRAALPVGATVVLYTDGVVEARQAGELYGTDRLDALLGRLRDRGPAALARAVTEDARAFAGGEVSDDLAVVAIRRTA